MDKQESLLTDMSRARPAEALSPKARRGHWQLVSYRTDEISGTMVLTRPETGAPEITLPLNAEGWYAIHLAFMGQTWAGSPLLKVKLSDDPCFTLVETEADHRHLEEGFWKIADLTGQDLVIAQQNTGEPQPASLAYVRLVPVTEEEVRRYQDRSGSRRLIAMNDAFSFYYSKGCYLPQVIQEELEPYRDTDFGKIFWETWEGAKSNYPAQVGRLWGQGTEDFARPGERRVARCMQEMKERGIDSLQVALEHAHGIGLEFYASIRFFFGMCPPGEFFEDPFFRDHPEFRCRDWDGTEVSHPSFAFPEVRQYVLSLLEDTANRYDVDGINLIFLRGQPYVLYEKPLVEGFRRQRGIDPTTLAEKDARWQWYEQVAMPTFWFGDRPAMEKIAEQRVTRLDELSPVVQDWLRFRSGALTEFMRGLRGLVKGIGKEQKLSAVVFTNEADNFFYGLDVETWVKEGLVDIIVAYPWPEYFEIDMGYFKRIIGGSMCELYANVMPRRMEPREYLKKAPHYYEQGVDGLAFWDTNARHPVLNQWQAVRELGHNEELGQWLETDRFPRKFLLLRRLGDHTVDRYHPESGG